MRSILVPFLGCLLGCGRIDFDTVEVLGEDSGIEDAAEPSLLLHVPFEGSIADVAAQRPVTCTNCPTLVPGRGGLVAAFSGTQCIEIPDHVAFHAQRLTLAVWFRPSSVSPTDSVFNKAWQQATGIENSWEILLNNAIVFATRSAGGSHYQYAGPHGLGSWRHVAGVFDGGGKRIYVDGVQIAITGTGLLEYDTAPIRIGCDMDNGGEVAHFKGEVDDARVYNRVLSDAEISALAQ